MWNDMNLAPVSPSPSAQAVQQDRERIRYAFIGAAGLIAGAWLVWLGGWLLGWQLRDLGVVPLARSGLVGILTAPLAHASLAHLMSNTGPLIVLATLTLYVYPRAARFALPSIWLLSGMGVWLFARPSVHLGASGITHGLMFFLFFMGLFRRDRLGIATSLIVFFLYGGMVMTVFPREMHISFEYHLAGALAGLLAAVLWFRADPPPPRKRYSWEDEEDEAQPIDDELEPPPPHDVPVLWQGPTAGAARDDSRGQVIEFPAAASRPRRNGDATGH